MPKSDSPVHTWQVYTLAATHMAQKAWDDVTLWCCTSHLCSPAAVQHGVQVLLQPMDWERQGGSRTVFEGQLEDVAAATLQHLAAH